MSRNLARAHELHSARPVIDGHNDLPWALRVRARGDLDLADPTGPLPGYHTDVPRLLAGGVGAQFWSVFVPSWTRAPFTAVLDQIALVTALVDRDPVHLAPATTATEVAAVRAAGRVACLIGAEGGHAIENDLGKLRELHARGVRYLTLTHADTIDWADSATDEPRHGGLTAFGVAVVAEMNRLGMLVDLSHVSTATMHRVLDLTEAPVVFSHSSAAAIAPHPRNVPDDVLERVAANGGVVMVNFYPGFVVASAARTSLAMFAEARRLRPSFADEAAFEEELRRRREARPMDRGTVADVADHVEHIARVAGVDHVGIGSDFDGIDLTPEGLEDVAAYPNLTRELLDRGWAEEEVLRILGGNALRVLRAVSG